MLGSATFYGIFDTFHCWLGRQYKPKLILEPFAQWVQLYLVFCLLFKMHYGDGVLNIIIPKAL